MSADASVTARQDWWMRIRLMTTDSLAGTPADADPARFAGLATASEALLAQGLADQLIAAGAEIDGVTSVPAADELPADPLADLAAINARVATAVASAMAADAAPVLVGGNCSHIIGMIGGIQRGRGPAA